MDWKFMLLAVLAALAVAGCSGSGAGAGFGEREPGLATDRARVDARAVLQQAAVSDDPMTRAHAMEAMGEVLGRQGGSMLLQSLNDKFVVVRYAAAMALGEIRYEPARQRLIEIVRSPGSDQRVVCAALYALSRLGNTDYAGQLGALLHSDFALGRAAAAEAMGKMGEPSAIGPLKSGYAQEEDPAAQVSMVEALARLGDSRSVRILESFANGYMLDLRLVAIPALAEIRAPRAGMILKRLQEGENPPRVRVAAAGAMGTLGQPNQQGYDLCRYGLQHPQRVLRDAYGEGKVIHERDLYSLQKLSAMGLGAIGSPQALKILHPSLDHADGSVRVAAAMAILQIVQPGTDPVAQPGSRGQRPVRKPLAPPLERSEAMD